MANFYWILEDGSGDKWELETATGGTDDWLLEDVPVVVDTGGGSGGSSKSVGAKSLADQQLGERPRRRLRDWTEGQILFRNNSESKGKLAIQVKYTSESIIKRLHGIGVVLSKITLHEKSISQSKLKLTVKHEATGYIHPIYVLIQKLVLKVESHKKLSQLVNLFNMMEHIDSLQPSKEALPQINVTTKTAEINRGDVLGVAAVISPSIAGQIWMRILDKKTSLIVQKAGLMGDNRSSVQAFIGTRDLPAGSYIIQFSTNRRFTPLGIAEFSVSKTLAPIGILTSTLVAGVISGAIITSGDNPDKPPPTIPEPPEIEVVQFHTMRDAKVDSACKKFDNKRYKVNNPNLPQIPIHFNCRCWYEPFSP